MLKTIKYVSGPPGSGKTHAIVADCKVETGKILIAQPTINLGNETFSKFQGSGIDCVILTKDHVHGSVWETVYHRLKNGPANQVTIITHATAFNLSVLPLMQTVKLYFDEVPDLDAYHAFRIPKNLDKLIPHLTWQQSTIHKDLLEIDLADKKKTLNFVRGLRDDLDDSLKGVLNDLCNGKVVYTDRRSFEKVAIKNNFTPNSKANESNNNYINFISLLTPEVLLKFKNPTILCANFENSLFYHYWSKNGYKFIEDANIVSRLRYTKHQNGHQVKLVYFYDNWSKAGRDSNIAEDVDFTRGQYMDLRMIKHVIANPSSYCYAVNNDYYNFELDRAGLERLPVKAQGLNKYEHIHNVYVGCALNKTPMHSRMLSYLGIDVNTQKISNYFETVYQIVNRISIRNPNSIDPVTIFVPCREVAEFIASHYIGCQIKHIDDQKWRKVVAVNRRRQKQTDEIKRLKDTTRIRCLKNQIRICNTEEEFLTKIGAFNDYYEPPPGKRAVSFKEQRRERENRAEDFSDEELLEIIKKRASGEHTHYAVDFKCSLLNPKDSNGNPLVNKLQGQALPIDDFKSLTYFRKCLADLSKIAYENKNDNYLISPSIFDPETGRRRSVDHKESYFVVLDIDDGDMIPEDVERIFRTKDHTQVFDITNTHSHDPEHNVNRYRVIVYTDSTMTADMYEACFDFLCDEIEAFGFVTVPLGTNVQEFKKDNPNVKTSGIDRSKRPPTSLFYLPAINAHTPEAAFFRSHYTEVKDIKRHIMAVSRIYANYLNHRQTELDELIYEEELQESVVEAAVETEVTDQRDTVDQPYVDKVIEEFNRVPVGDKQRNHEGYRLTCRLMSAFRGAREPVRTLLDTVFTDDKMLHRMDGYIKSSSDWYHHKIKSERILKVVKGA